MEKIYYLVYYQYKDLKKLNKSYELKHYNRLWNYINFSDSISLSNNSHLKYRNNLVDYILSKLDIDKSLDKINVKNCQGQFTYFLFNSNLFYIIYFLFIIIGIIILKKYF